MSRGGSEPKTKRRIPEGWEYVTADYGDDAAWRTAIAHKTERERLRPDLFVRVKAMASGVDGWWWVIRKDEPREKETER
jgi:hypothetical protein